MASSGILNMIDGGEPRRGAVRRRVMLSARLQTSTSTHDVIIRDVSATGARIETDDLPEPGTTVMLKRGTFLAYGSLVWANGEAGGIQFDEPLDEDELMDALKGLPAPSQTVEPYRRPGLDRGGHPRFSDGRGWIDTTLPRR